MKQMGRVGKISQISITWSLDTFSMPAGVVKVKGMNKVVLLLM